MLVIGKNPKTNHRLPLFFEVELKWLAKILKFKIRSFRSRRVTTRKPRPKPAVKKLSNCAAGKIPIKNTKITLTRKNPRFVRPPKTKSFCANARVEELKTIVQALQLGATDPWQLTDLIFYARHPEMKGQPLTDQNLLDEWNSISALLVHPTINEIKNIVGAEDLTKLGDDKIDLEKAFAKASNVKINAGSLEFLHDAI